MKPDRRQCLVFWFSLALIARSGLIDRVLSPTALSQDAAIFPGDRDRRDGRHIFRERRLKATWKAALDNSGCGLLAEDRRVSVDALGGERAFARPPRFYSSGVDRRSVTMRVVVLESTRGSHSENVDRH